MTVEAINKRHNKISEKFFLLFSLLIFFYFLVFRKFTVGESFIVGYQLYLVLRFINNIGYTICFFDFLCFYSAMDTLVMPVIGYNVYNENNPLSRMWGWYMRVPEEVYFSFLIPANLALFLSTNILLFKYKTSHFKKLLEDLAVKAKDKGKVGIVLTIIGFISTFLENIESTFSFVFHLFSMLKYVGPLYIYFSNSPFRNKVLIISLVAFMIQAISRSMFGEFVMYSTLATIVLSIKFNLRFATKLSVFVVGLFLVVVLQSIKGAYRTVTWRGKTINGLSLKNSSPVEIFSTLFIERITDAERLLDEKTAFAVYMRMNQGYLISRTMDYVPRVEPYANGSTIIRTIGAILVPRFLWPDKPESGGRENLARFVGIKHRLNYSMNIGPYGEAYGNFGPQYGLVFIFIFGLFLSLLLRVFLNNCFRRPTLLLWAPLLFYYTLTVETDILSTLNSSIKGALFVLIIFWISKSFFKVSL